MPFSQQIAIVLEFGFTEIETIGAIIDLRIIVPFFLSLSISSNNLLFSFVIFASMSTTMKSGQTKG